ncbi:hypothetical protein ACRJ4B_49920 [Streptomyces sp. GTA36]
MTTQTPRVPTPRDLVARDSARRAAEMIAPGTLLRGERFRPLFERGIHTSGMTPHTRLVALALLAFANGGTGDLPAERQPYLAGLVEATGLTTGQVVVQLRALEARGWIHRDSSGSARYEEALLRPVIPRHALERLRAS